jgi:hypothetical protein
MSEVERNMSCENCGASCRLIYDPDDINYRPENCPFCGEIVEFINDDGDLPEDEENDDDDDNDSWS